MKKKMKNPVTIGLLLAFILALFCVPAQAQVTTTLSPVAKQQFFNSNGAPLAGGFIYTYSAGTSTPAPTYVDSSGLFQNTNPIVLDPGGFANIWLAQQGYKFVVTDANNVQQYSIDNINAFNLLFQNNTFTGINTFTQLQWNSGGPFLGIFAHTNSANRTYTFPDSSGNVCISSSCSLSNPTITSPSFTGTSAFLGPATFSAGLTTGFLTSASGGAATTGVIRLAAGDCVTWNIATFNLCLQGGGQFVTYNGTQLVNNEATGTQALGTTLIASGACATTITIANANVLGAETVVWSFATSPKAVTGYGGMTAGALNVYATTSVGNINIDVCNNTAGSITPGAINVAYKVIR